MICLTLMTKDQAIIYETFASRILCNHKTNMYDFKLLTFLVVDEFHKGYPVAFCILNREDSFTISMFLNLVKSNCPKTKVSIFMTDDDISSINAVKNVFGSDIKNYLCIWHINQSWRRKLHSSVHNKSHKVEIYYFLHSLLHSKTENEFNTYLNKFLNKYQNLETNFISYFRNNYLTKLDQWAIYFRHKDLQTEITTNMYLESFHNKLKTIYFQRKQNKRLDHLIYILLQMEKHFYLNRLKLTTYNKPSGYRFRNF